MARDCNDCVYADMPGTNEPCIKCDMRYPLESPDQWVPNIGQILKDLIDD